MANPSRSMGYYKRFCTDKAEAIDKLLAELKDRDITAKEALKPENLNDDLEAQFSRLHAKWEDLCTANCWAVSHVNSQCAHSSSGPDSDTILLQASVDDMWRLAYGV